MIYHIPQNALVTSHIKFQSPVPPLPPMCGCRYTTITKVMTLGSHKKGGTAGVHRCLGLVPQVTLLLLFCGKTHGTFMVSYGK